MATVLIATGKGFSNEARDEAIKIIEEGGLEVKVIENYSSTGKDPIKMDLVDNPSSINGIIVRSDKVKQDVIDAFPNIELVVRAGAGYDNIDTKYSEQKGIIVENTPGQNSNAVAELAIQMMLRSIRPFNGKIGKELKGKKLAIHAFGNVGQSIAKKGKGHEMNVMVYDLFLDKSKAKEHGVAIANSSEELYKDADFVSINIPKNKKTIGTINYDLIKLMPENGILVNTARAEVIDEEGLVKILEERPGFKYLTDVMPSEKTRKVIDEKFKERVIMTPKKQGAQSEEANYNSATAAARQCVDFFKDGKILNNVNNPLSGEMRDYTTLAQALGKFNSAFIQKPSKVQIICYSELDKFKDQLSQYVLKGLFEDEFGKDMTPTEALESAKYRGIELIYRNPDNNKGYGRSMTIDYFNEAGETHSIRGRIDEGELQIHRVGEFMINIPIVPGIFVLAQYNEETGKADKIGSAFSNQGYNKVDGGFRQNKTKDKAITFYRIEKDGESIAQVEEIMNKNIKTLSGVYRAHAINMK